MAWTVEIIDEAGTTHDLSDGTITEFVWIDGTGIPPVERLVERAPVIDGAFDRGFRLLPRRMNLHLVFENDRSGPAETARDTLSKIFRPTLLPLKLKITRDDSEVRQIDCYLEDELDFPMSSRILTGRQDIDIQLYAPNPIWYDPTQVITTVDMSSGINSAALSTSDMTWFDWPVIVCTGPLTNLIISHSDMGASLSFSGATIPGSDAYTIDMRDGFKTIENNAGTNKINDLTAATLPNFFGEFRIWDEKYIESATLSDGTDNNFSISASSTTGASEVEFQWYKRYLNI